MADVAGFSMVAEAMKLTLRPLVSDSSASGFIGVHQQDDGKDQVPQH